MKLTERESEVLAHLELNANATAAEIAKAIGTKSHTVRHALSRLLQNEILIARPFIDIYRLGYRYFYLRVRPLGQYLDSPFEPPQSLVEHQNVSLIYQGGGGMWHVLLAARDLAEVEKFAEELDSSLDFHTPRLEMWYVRHWSFWGHLETLRSKSRVVGKHYRVAPAKVPVEIDGVDHEILCGLTHQQTFSVPTLSRALGMAPNTVRYRLKKLEESKVILGYAYRAPADRVPLCHGVVSLKLAKCTRKTEDKIYALCKRYTAIGYLCRYMGRFDYDLGVAVKHQTELPAVLDAIRKALGREMIEFEYSPVFMKPKVFNYPFVEF